MKKIFCFFMFIPLFLYSAQTTKDKIKNTSLNLENSKVEQKKINQKIDDLGSEIIKGQNELKNTQKDVENLSSIVSNLQDKYKQEDQEISQLNSQNIFLMKSKKDIEDKIIKIIADDLSFELAQNNNETKTVYNIIANELFKSLSSIISNELEKLVKTYNDTVVQINDKNLKISTIQANLKDYNDKKNKLVATQNKEKKEIENLKKSKEEYISKLEDIHNQQEAIQNTLQELKIIDDKEEREKAKKAEEKRLAKLPKGQISQDNIQDDAQKFPMQDERIEKVNSKIKEYGSSYQASRVKKYVGPKTASPLNGAYVKRGFGNYLDPVYNIKIFNESVILSSSSDTQVKNVLDGKIIFAKDTAILHKVVIIEHSNGIHTIYAQMSQIAPTIQVGKNIKKGYVIGRINGDLTFEVTQKNYHINPSDLITLK